MSGYMSMSSRLISSVVKLKVPMTNFCMERTSLIETLFGYDIRLAQPMPGALILVQYLCRFPLISQDLHEEGECWQLEFWTGKEQI